MATIKEILSAIEEMAPRYLQEDYDNACLQVGDAQAQAKGALLCVDVTEAVIDEAIDRGVNLVISHHPLIFRGLKSLTGANPTQRIVAKAIKNDIAIYSAHTNLDSARGGVSYGMAEKLRLSDVRVLSPHEGKQVKVVVYVPTDYADAVEQAMFAQGAGSIGDYDSCSYRISGEGRYRASSEAHPFSGEVGEHHVEPETRVEVIVDAARKDAVVAAMLAAHPYEEPAYDVIALLNQSPYTGFGVVGNIEPMALADFLALVKTTFNVDAIRYSGDENAVIKRVALCGGSGAELVGDAIAQGADIYVTGDIKYHDFTSNNHRIVMADIGHYESEQFTKDIFYEIIRKKMPNFALYFAEKEIKQVKFYI
ncbi:MAG: Nif3-like dinuclear metal center hexameric protein [Muribaculaceae bacterium]